MVSTSLSSATRILYLWLGILLCVICGNTHAKLILEGENYRQLSVGQQLLILEDRTGELSLESILENPDSYPFYRFTKEVPSFGYTNSTYWAKLQISNNSDNHYRWVMEIPYAPLDSVTLYVETSDGYIEKTAGDSLPFSSRELEFPTPAFFFETKPRQSQDIYIKVASTSSLQIPVTLWSHKGFVSSASSTLLFWGVYFGILLIAAGYNLFLYFSFKDRTYLFYVGFVLMVMLFQLSVQGFASQYLWPNYPQITNLFLLATLNAMGVFGGIFSIQFLRLKESIPVINYIVMTIVTVMVINIVFATLAPYRLILRLSILFFATGTITLLFAGCISWAKGYTPARIYVFAWIAMLSGAFTFSLKTLGLVPTNPITHYAVTIGSAIEVVLLSLAIGDRINLERKEKQSTKNKLFDVQKELLQAKQESLQNAELSDKKKQEFLATMSHELRTPLNGILGCTQLLEEAKLENEEHQTVLSLSSSAKQMLSHVNRILNFSQLHEGTLDKDEVNFDMQSLADAIKQAYGAQCTEKSLALDITIDEPAQGIYKGDKQKLLMVLSDLVENAIKFTTTGAITIEVTAQREYPQDNTKNIDDFWLSFSVKDTGCGINAEHGQDIFQMFNQEDSSFKRSYEGLGLGLAICKKYVELLGGEIRFESEQGKGSIFYVSLPLTKCIALESDQTNHGSSEFLANNERILIVEDNPTNQTIMAKMLSKLGFDHQIAANGQEAIDLLNQEAFELILMDCHMPVMDGFEATSKIRATPSRHQHTPIIAVTANAMAGDRERCLKAGMNDYIAKPFSKDLLASKLKFWFLNHPEKTSKSNPIGYINIHEIG